MNAPEARPEISGATESSAYRYWITEHVRFADLDLQGHVNNKAFTVYAESGRAAFLRELGFWAAGATRQSVVVRLEIDYRRELHYPGEVRVGVRVLKIGKTSFTLGLGIFDAAGECAATVVTILARVSTEHRGAIELNAEERARLETHLGR